jgi:uncharacterized membrane protein
LITLILVLRLLHIVAAAFWFGALVTTVFFIEPAAEAFGADGERFLAHIASRRRLVAVLVVAAVITALAGAALYWIDSGGLNANWITTRTGLVFTAGAIAGIVAFFIPIVAFRPTLARLDALAKDQKMTGDAASERVMGRAVDARVRRWGIVQAGLLLFAIAAMAAARYVP